jgi:hypothetical protein
VQVATRVRRWYWCWNGPPRNALEHISQGRGMRLLLVRCRMLGGVLLCFFFVCKEMGSQSPFKKKQGFFPKCVHGVGCHVHTPLQGFALDDGRRHHAGVMGAGLLVGRGGVLT